MDLVSIIGEAFRGHHDAGVVDQNVQARLPTDELGRGRFDTRERCKVQLQEMDVGELRIRLLEVRNSLFSFIARTGGEVDPCWVMFAKLADGLISKAHVASGHDDDLALEIGDVLTAECRHGEITILLNRKERELRI